jgi:SAM-dependent methyltransferase
MHWKLKGLIQKTLGAMPGGHELHYRMQRRFGGLRDFRREFSIKVDDWKIMIEQLKKHDIRLQGADLLEIGTGWYPTFPFACYLAGAASVRTFDLNRYLRPDLVRQCAQGFGEWLPTIAAAAEAELDEVRARYEALLSRLGDGSDLERATGGVVRYHAPADATVTGLADASVDLVFSNSVLEHIAPAVLEPLYRESRRILRPGGAMFHSVNCGDHYAYVDRSIHALNYLQYSDRAWKLWDNAFLYQNRLRAHVFVDAARESGFDLIFDSSTARPERLKQLASIRVDARFAGIPPELLCITSVDLIARKPARAIA